MSVHQLACLRSGLWEPTLPRRREGELAEGRGLLAAGDAWSPAQRCPRSAGGSR